MSIILQNPDAQLLCAVKSNRDVLDNLRSRIELLSGKDRLLITMYLDNGNSFRQISILTGVNEVTIARRIKKIMLRLSNEDFIRVLRNKKMFSKRQMKISRDYFLRGQSIREISTKYRMSFYGVYQVLQKIRKLKNNSKFITGASDGNIHCL